jgi:type IX secretion system PorP/SprF family membrane protein
LLLSVSGSYKAQDIHFSQALETPLMLSPANTGFFNGYFRAIANYRNQWASMNKAYQTMGLSLDGGVFRSRKRPAFLGIGFTIFNDQAGAAKMRKLNAMLNMSGILKINSRSALSVGLAGGTSGMNANYDQLRYESQFDGNQLDGSISSGEPGYIQQTTMDASAGIAYEFGTVSRDNDRDDVKSFRLSFGAFHLNRAKEVMGSGTGYREPIRFTSAFTSVFDINDTKISVTPTIIHHLQASAQELLVGTYIKVRTRTGTKVTGTKSQNSLGFGVFYRSKDALIPKLLAEFGDFAVGLSYDVNLSAYRSASNYQGGFEVSLRYNNLASSLFEAKREFR